MVAVRQPEHVAGNWQRAARSMGQSISPLPGRPGRHRATRMSFVLVTATLRRPQAHQVNIHMPGGTRLAYTEPRASTESGGRGAPDKPSHDPAADSDRPRYLPPGLGSDLPPPLATATSAGRSTRSPIM